MRRWRACARGATILVVVDAAEAPLALEHPGGVPALLVWKMHLADAERNESIGFVDSEVLADESESRETASVSSKPSGCSLAAPGLSLLDQGGETHRALGRREPPSPGPMELAAFRLAAA